MTALSVEPHPRCNGAAHSSDALWLAPALLVAARLLPLPRGGAIAGLPSICPFYHLTGLPCPACGLTRSMVCCAHGLWHQAVTFHPMGPALFAATVAATAVYAVGLVQPRRRWAPSTRFITLLTWTAGICTIGLWAARLAGGLPGPG